MRKQHVWRIAVAGNAAVLLLLLSVFAHGPLLFVARAGVSRTVVTHPLCTLPSHTASEHANRLLVVIVDALRLDKATDRAAMPTLTALAKQGGSGASVVETLIPSTVAAIQALVAGVIVPPLAFVEDFTAPPAEHGGILAAIKYCNGYTFVAGPQLWTDLYGAWITTAVTTPGFVEDDERLLRATSDALDQNVYQLVIVHFSRPDHAAHQYGARSEEYARAVRWCDDAIAQMFRHIDASTAVVITADHGVTQNGGHAGLEPVVRLTPLVTWGPGVPSGVIPAMPQAALPLMLRSGLERSSFSKTVTQPLVLPWVLRLVMIVFLGLALFSVLRLLMGLQLDSGRTPPDAWLNVTIWLTLLCGYYGRWQIAFVLGVTVLVVTAWRVPRLHEYRLVRALGGGCLFGGLRLLDGMLTSAHDSQGVVMASISLWSAGVLISVPVLAVGSRVASVKSIREVWNARSQEQWLMRCLLMVSAVVLAYSVGGIPLATVVLIVIGVGYLLGCCMFMPTAYSPVGAGIAAAFVPAAAARLVGETVSLSTIDVHAAFSVADSVLGIAGAVVVAIVRQALLSVSFCMSVAWALRDAAPANVGRFAASCASTFVAQAFPATVVLFVGERVDATLVSLALGTIVHLLNEVTFCFLALAGAIFCYSRGGVRHIGTPLPHCRAMKDATDTGIPLNQQDKEHTTGMENRPSP